MWVLSRYMFRNLAFENLLQDLCEKAIKVVKVLIFRIVLRIYCKLFSKYLTTKKAVECSRTELKARLGAEIGLGGASFKNKESFLLIHLSLN